MIEKSCDGPPARLLAIEIEIVSRLVRADRKTGHKRIALELGLPLGTVNRKIKEISAKIPGRNRPSMRISVFFWDTLGGSTQALDGCLYVPEDEK